MDNPIPEDIRDFPPLVVAWAACLRWAVGEPRIMAEFERDTGMTWRPPNSPIEAMIDEATGYSDASIEKFIQWFNENIW